MSFRRSDVVPSPEQLYTGIPETADLDAAKKQLQDEQDQLKEIRLHLY